MIDDIIETFPDNEYIKSLAKLIIKWLNQMVEMVTKCSKIEATAHEVQCCDHTKHVSYSSDELKHPEYVPSQQGVNTEWRGYA